MKKYRVERTVVVTQDVHANSAEEALEMIPEEQADLTAMTFVDEIDVKVTEVTEELKGASE